ncbi:type VI secretion system tip protein VgrG [Vibrio sp. CAIM 722]|uniref:Type VI secretion system tip protein VgrG n=1 Tax=Vibrio eleionomae TaxID=2653505 RepID=A0A7X4RWK1_9VIBR|nr:type VI secretion system tip protein VgrG [Vibrio eleionomae]MZI95289.1 type VI secretion system tip protein VgrG [Vibrio eleionomae]
MARLGYSIKIDGVEDDTLVVRRFEGHESLSDSLFKGQPCYGFKYFIELATRQTDLTPDQVVDKMAELTLYRDDEVVQRVNGVVRNFTQGDIGHNYTFYSLTLVPALERLSLRQNSRLFQLKTVPEIISILLQEMGVTDYAFNVQRECAQREFCVQYRETDLELIHRLAAEEGLVYSFVHEEGKHTLLFTDGTSSLPSITNAIPYNALSGGTNDTPYVSHFNAHTQSDVSRTALQDYSFKKPSYQFAQSAEGTNMDYQLTDNYEHFDAPGRFKDDTSGKAFNSIRLEFLRRNAKTFTGKGNQPLMRAGYQFTLEEHLNDEMNSSYLLVAVSHQGEQPQALEEESGSGATTYSNQFKAIPSTVNWQATPQPKPQVDGPMIARVVGPEGEEIFCDKYGRVKVHFPWDRYSNADEQSSCWVRVSQGWAGPQYGTMAIPRIGHEVIVSFLNGDPDQPIITGRTYHATNTQPYVLPDNKTKTVLRTETHQGEGYNELSFEDQADSEKIFVHAQKDYEALVENDHTQVIHNDKHLTVDRHSYTQVKNNQHLTVKGESRNNITKDKTIDVTGSLHQKVTDKTIIDSGSEVHLKAGNKIVLDAGDELTISASGSFIKLDASGVTVVGSAINLNSGGSAGAGSGYGGLVAALPTSLEDVEALAETEGASVVASQTEVDSQLKSATVSSEQVEAVETASSSSSSAISVGQQIEALTGKDAVAETCSLGQDS